MRKIITICIIGLFTLNVQAQPVKTLKLSDKELLDKIKGGWVGQTIGVVFEHLQSLSSRELIFKITSRSPGRKVTLNIGGKRSPDCSMIFITIARLLRHLMNLAWIVHKEELAKRFAFADYHLAPC